VVWTTADGTHGTNTATFTYRNEKELEEQMALFIQATKMLMAAFEPAPPAPADGRSVFGTWAVSWVGDSDGETAIDAVGDVLVTLNGKGSPELGLSMFTTAAQLLDNAFPPVP
jgi:hypothetical protein